MQPDRIDVRLRPRTAMEAVDLGFALAQRHAAALRSAWLRIVLPVMLVLALISQWLPPQAMPAFLLLWWGKPLYDAVLVLVLSRAIFGEPIGTRELLAELRRHAGTIFAALTWRRASLSRGFLLPAYLLEGLHGAERRARVQQLRDETTATARTTTLAVFGFHAVLWFSFVALAFWLTPEVLRERLGGIFDDVYNPWILAGWQLFYVVAITCTEPFYVAAGFALYLNRRTMLEGWDIEVALRSIAARVPAVAAEPAEDGNADAEEAS